MHIDIDKAFPILIYSDSIAKPLINHTGISLAISVTATNISNKCETANHLKSKCLGIQLQDQAGEGTATFPTFFVFSWPGQLEAVKKLFFFAQDTNQGGKIIKVLRFWSHRRFQGPEKSH